MTRHFYDFGAELVGVSHDEEFFAEDALKLVRVDGSQQDGEIQGWQNLIDVAHFLYRPLFGRRYTHLSCQSYRLAFVEHGYLLRRHMIVEHVATRELVSPCRHEFDR